MADDSDLPEILFAESVVETHTITKYVADMTTEAAGAYVAIAERQFAVPAKQKTLQVLIETTGRTLLAGVLSAIACATLTGEPLAWVLFGIAGVFGGKPLIEAFTKKSG